MARQLLTYKVDIWIKEHGKTALDVALEVAAEKPGSLEVLVDLHDQYKDYKEDAGLTFLMLAVKHGRAKHIKQLVDRGMEKDARSEDGSGKKESLTELCQNDEGQTALMLAMQGGEEFFELLLGRGVKTGLKTLARRSWSSPTTRTCGHF